MKRMRSKDLIRAKAVVRDEDVGREKTLDRTRTHIPVFDLKPLHKSIRKELNTAIDSVIDGGNFILGENVRAFEKEFASYIGTKYAIGVASGTDALTLSLAAHGIGPGDEVILPANAYPTAFGVAKTGVTIRLVDVDDSGNINPELLPKAITKKTKAIIIVHLYGTPANIGQIQKATRHFPHIILIEDAAQAHGATVKDRKAGSIGRVGCFSFYPSKNLGALGDGGMIVTNQSAIAGALKQLRMYGEVSRYQSQAVSGVSRLDELHAAILRVKLRHLDTWVRRRREIASLYLKNLSGVGDLSFLHSTSDIEHSALHLFVIRSKKRDALMEYLAKHGVGTGIHYPAPIHTQKAFRHLGYYKGDFPMTEKLCQTILSLPIYPTLTNAAIMDIVNYIKKFFLARA